MIEITRARNPFVIGWTIRWKGKVEGYIVKSQQKFLVVRLMRDKQPGEYYCEVRARKDTVGEAMQYVHGEK
jgi:hypothetical protein